MRALIVICATMRDPLYAVAGPSWAIMKLLGHTMDRGKFDVGMWDRSSDFIAHATVFIALFCVFKALKHLAPKVVILGRKLLLGWAR